jgi:uncharacterized protein
MAQMHPLRIEPGEDLRNGLEAFVRGRGIGAAFVSTGIGSLSVAVLRMAGAKESIQLDGPLEILSLAGTAGPEGAHLHMAVSDSRGLVRGGHVCRGCRIRTTAEIVLGEIDGAVFLRRMDPATGYRELEIRTSDALQPPGPE